MVEIKCYCKCGWILKPVYYHIPLTEGSFVECGRCGNIYEVTEIKVTKIKYKTNPRKKKTKNKSEPNE